VKTVPVSTDGKILNVVEALYDAAVDETLWPKAMGQLVDVTDSNAATFCVIDGSERPRLPVFMTFNFEQRFIDEYLQGMVLHDPTVQYIVAHPDRKIVHDSEFITEREKDKLAYYDWHASFSDTRHRLAGMVNPAPHVQSGVTLHRTRKVGDFESGHIDRFQFLYRHLDRAVRIGFQLGTLGTMQRMSYELLDANPAGIFVLDDKGYVLFANRAARALAAADEGIVLNSQGLSLIMGEDDSKLQTLIAQATAHGARDRVASGGAMQALRRSGKRPYSITVSPLSRTSLNVTTMQPSVCVIIADADQGIALPETLLHALYGMTRAEARLAARLASGEDLQAAAASLGISYPTARTQLSAIFRKTDTRRQGELIKVLLSCIPPVTR
jgi:DNA-binding CsgD family transcriptional regulator/PAS domain-containing protein